MKSLSFHCVAVTRGAWSALKHGRALGVRASEWRRYLGKAVNLTLCYAGLGRERNLSDALKAADAAFLCCAYDVVTDWRSFDDGCRVVFENLLRELGDPSLAAAAMDLYWKERHGSVAFDGLDRGVDALRFVTQMIGRNDSVDELHRWGIVLQIVDDVLDYEEDLKNGDLNCLTSPRRQVYLSQVLTLEEDELRMTFPHGHVLVFVVRHARRKAQRLVTSMASARGEPARVQ